MLGSGAHFFQILGIAIARRRQPQIVCRKIADGIAVHRQLRRARGGHDGEALAFQFLQHRSADRLDLRHDVVGPMPLDRVAQLVAVEHREHLARIGHLHGGRVVVGVAGHDIGAQPLGRNNEFAPQFARTEQQDSCA